MRTLIKYISLLIISGLIIPFCLTIRSHKTNVAVSQANATANNMKIVCDTPQMHYFGLQQILEFAIPALKK